MDSSLPNGSIAGDNVTELALNKGGDHSRDLSRALFTLTACLTLLGNGMVLALFARCPNWLKKPHNQCILSLALTDTFTGILLLVVPKFVQDSNAYPVPDNHTSREFYCRFIWSHFLPFALGITSVYTCLVLAIERWYAVMRPLQYKAKFNVRTMRLLIAMSWLAGFLFETPIIPRVRGVSGSNVSRAGCQWTSEENKTKTWFLAIILFVGQTFAPCCAMLCAYYQILTRFKQERSFHFSSRVSLPSGKAVNTGAAVFKKATVMMAVASLTLILCWLPNQIYFMLAQLGYLELKPTIGVRIVNVLAFFNSWMNPIIYGFMNKRFREQYRKLLLPCLKKSLETVPSTENECAL